MALSTPLIRKLAKKLYKELFPGIPEPKTDVETLYKSVQALKQGYEQLTRGRGDAGTSALLVREIDDILEVLVSFFDTRYTQGEPAALTTLAADLASLLASLTNHIAASGIHFADAPDSTIYGRQAGSWVEIVHPEVDFSLDLIDDSGIATDKTWSSSKIWNVFNSLELCLGVADYTETSAGALYGGRTTI